MTFVNKIFERATIRGVTDYLLFNESPLVEKKADYKTRLEEAYQSCQSVLLLYDKDQESALFRSVDELLNETELVYMEIGVQAGFLLTSDIMNKTNSFENSVKDEKSNVDYQIMYDSLFHDASKALKILEKGEKGFIDIAIRILKGAQCKTEALFIRAEK